MHKNKIITMGFLEIKNLFKNK